ncbi:hypothetical protein NM688_g8534 [Phlebia brevispora]|uniref:Uncharacterized protein n=1 Tax=Phlebia brevispora TaxID=194682 RepID=A0ACC1RU96_9APHY|nr:hypothetical protein NM688_g8534 [Phlebia brevispora]
MQEKQEITATGLWDPDPAAIPTNSGSSKLLYPCSSSPSDTSATKSSSAAALPSRTKMFARLYASFFYVLCTLSLLAVATPWGVTPTVTVTVTAPAPTVTTVSQCNTGSISCCDQVLDSSSEEANLLLGLLGIVLDGVTGLLGLDCSPISVIGVGSGSECSASPVCCENNSVHEEGLPRDSPEFLWKLLLSAGLVLAGGVFAGLTLGLMGLDELHLRVLSTASDDPTERANAAKVLKLLRKGRHWVLVVLLLGNVIVNESLPIFLDDALGGGLPAIVISTTMIGGSFAYDSQVNAINSIGRSDIWVRSSRVLTCRIVLIQASFHPDSEIIPQAVSVRYGLSIGAACVPIVLAMMYIFAPIAWPTAKLLDFALGKGESHTYKKAELKSFLQFHRQGEEPLKDEEILILNGVLELANKNVSSLMTPMKDVVTISSDTVLDHDAVNSLLRSGYSRIPVHEPGRPLAFFGLLLVKKLSVYDPSQALPVSKFPLSILPEADPSISNLHPTDLHSHSHHRDFSQTGRAHLLLLSNTPGKEGGAIGVITLEDIIEEIISEEIVDETDRYEDNQSKRRARRLKNAAVMRGCVILAYPSRYFRSSNVYAL